MTGPSQKMINEQNNSRPVKKHYELQIKTLQIAPRDADELERILHCGKLTLILIYTNPQQQQSSNKPSSMLVRAIGTHHEEIATLREKIDSVEGKLKLILQLLEDKIKNKQ
jgi:hypothetical protein